jgi:hypothetical protein
LLAEFSTAVNDLPWAAYQAAKQACLKMLEEQGSGRLYSLCPFNEIQVRVKVRGIKIIITIYL